MEFVYKLKECTPELIRMRVLSETGFDKLSTDPEAMFSKAVQKYCIEDPKGFTAKMVELESKNKYVLNQILTGRATLESIPKLRNYRNGSVQQQNNAIEEVDEQAHESNIATIKEDELVRRVSDQIDTQDPVLTPVITELKPDSTHVQATTAESTVVNSGVEELKSHVTNEEVQVYQSGHKLDEPADLEESKEVQPTEEVGEITQEHTN